MKKTVFLVVLFLLVNSYSCASTVKVEKGWLYVDGEKYFVKGIGYKGWRQGQHPGTNAHWTNKEFMDEDLKLIKDAGFNTVRTWDARSKDEVDMYAKYGLMVMFGFWFDQDRLKADENYLNEIVKEVKRQTEEVKDCPNILMYLPVGCEPNITLVRDMGEKRLLECYKKIRDAVRSVDPKRPVALTYWDPIIFLDHSLWDVFCANNYYHSPVTTNYSLGYRCYNEYLVNKVAGGKPYVNTEFTVILGPKIYGGADYLKYSYGGNTPEQQKEGVIELYNDLIAAGAHGVSVLDLMDQWWVMGNPDKQDPHPEEWLGVAALTPNEEGGHAKPRPAYYALKDFNQALLISPRDMEIVKGKFPVEVYATEGIKDVTAQAQGREIRLKKTGHRWFTGEFDISGLEDRVIKLAIKAKSDGENTYTKEACIWIKSSGPLEAPLKLTMKTSAKKVKPGGEVTVKVEIKDDKGKPVKGKDVYLSMFFPFGWVERTWEKQTDENGTVELKIELPAEKGWVNIAAGTDFTHGEFKKRIGDLAVVFIE